MSDPHIPVHHLPAPSRMPTRVERFGPKPLPVPGPVHRHDFNELFFFTQGGGAHMIDLERIAFTAPCVHVVAPGQVHQLERSPDSAGLVVMFSPEALLGQGHAARAELFAWAQGPKSFAVDAAQLTEAQLLIGLMEGELDRPEGPVAEVVEGYLGILLIKCARWAGAPGHTAPAGHDLVRRFIDLVERTYLHQRQVAHYAEELAISADHLNELVKARLGRTASKVVQDRLLLEAKRLLLHAELSVKEVGYTLGMHDQPHFTRWFSKLEGRTPVEYRAHIRDLYKP